MRIVPAKRDYGNLVERGLAQVSGLTVEWQENIRTAADVRFPAAHLHKLGIGGGE